MHSVCEQNDLNETFWLTINSSLRLGGHLWLIFGSLSNDDGNVSENGKKATGLDWQNNNLQVHHTFLFIFLPSLHDYDVKMPIFTFCGRREYKKRLSFSFPELRFSLSEFNSRKNLPTFDELIEME